MAQGTPSGRRGWGPERGRAPRPRAWALWAAPPLRIPSASSLRPGLRLPPPRIPRAMGRRLSSTRRRRSSRSSSRAGEGKKLRRLRRSDSSARRSRSPATSSSSSRRKGAALLRRAARGESSSSPSRERRAGLLFQPSATAAKEVAGSAAVGMTAAPPATPAVSRPPDAVSRFVELNGLDVAAGNALRALPLELQQDVMAEGSVRGRNPSAILMARIRKVQSTPR
uniref:Uncharacterized protein n=1 Tax=Alexandrium monilatum TaxID=311494 RepID=A0A7S4QH61_9DINO